MALINRVAISNILNYHGDSLRAPWYPRFQYECLDFRGHSTAINLTNGGGKTTLAEAVIAVLSRDRSLVTSTKGKMSPKSNDTWSHVQVELIRPFDSAAQNDLLTESGNSINGEHWVFGLCGYRGEPSITYYYYKGRLEDLPIGQQDGTKKTLTPNLVFTETRGNIAGLVWGATEGQWNDALALKANLPLSVVRQLAFYQKRGGDDKSALLFDTKPRPGESFAAAFFYKFLAPVVMEGVMDREGEEGEVSLEDTVERAVFSTVRAKQDTEAVRLEEELLGRCVKSLGQLMNTAYEYEDRHEKYSSQVKVIQTEVQVLKYLVPENNLIGIPKTNHPDGLTGEVSQFIAVEAGTTDILISDAGLGLLLSEEPKYVNQRASRGQIRSRVSRQVVDFACDLEIQSPKRGTHPERFYTLGNAKELLIKAVEKLGGRDAVDQAIEHLDDAFSWFDEESDTNPYRARLFEAELDIKQLKEQSRENDNSLDDLQQQRQELSARRDSMKANAGSYELLVKSNIFSAREIENLDETLSEVESTLTATNRELELFNSKKSKLSELEHSWSQYVELYGDDRAPQGVLDEETQKLDSLKADRASLSDQLDSVAIDKEQISAAKTIDQIKLATAQSTLDSLDAQRLKHFEFCREIGETEGFSGTNTWLEQAQTRRSSIQIAISNKEEELSTIRDMRTSLDTQLIAPGAIARKAYTCLSDKGVDYQPIYEVIESLDLEDTRRKSVLSAFSSVLFAPVMPNAEATIAAASALSDLDLQLPIFCLPNIAEYCALADIKTLEGGLLYVGTTAGVVSQAVECILDPSLVESEKRRLDQEIVKRSADLQVLGDELSQISEQSPLIILARSSSQYLNNNGPSEHSNLQKIVNTLSADIEGLNIRAIELESTLKSLNQDLAENARNIAEGLTVEREKTLRLAINFYEMGGIEFLDQADNELASIESRLKLAKKRYGYQENIKGANLYLKNNNSDNSSTDVIDEIGRLGDEIQKAREFREVNRSQRDVLDASIPALKSALHSIDSMAQVALSKYRKVALSEKDVGTGSSNIEDHQVVRASIDLEYALKMALEPDVIKLHADKMSNLLQEFETDRKGDDLRRSKKELLRLEASFVEEAHAIAESSDVLSPSEKEVLSLIVSDKGIAAVRTLHEGLLDQLNRIKERVQLCGAAEKDSRSSVALRLSSLIEFATNDLHIMRQVLSRKYGKHASYFNVNAQVLDQQGIEALLTSILNEVDVSEKQRREREVQGLDAPEDAQYHQSLRATIRERLYKNIFSKPTITYVNKTIRASGEANEFNDKLSEGQKAALSLMWTIRLAEFSIVREAKRLSSRRAQSKAMATAENVIIVDGLFTNLSDKALIDSAMDGIEATRGRFQLIGLIHNTHYQNDYEKFPVFIVGKNERGAQSSNSWVAFSPSSEQKQGEATSLRTAQIRLVKDTSPAPIEVDD